jgi:hypothetical protein
MLESGITLKGKRATIDGAVQVTGGVKGTWLIDNTVRDNGNDGIDNWGIATLIRDNTTRDSCGADLAGKGDGGGTVDGESGENIVKDGTDLTSTQELELDTLP